MNHNTHKTEIQRILPSWIPRHPDRRQAEKFALENLCICCGQKCKDRNAYYCKKCHREHFPALYAD